MSWENAAYTRAGAALLSESVSGGALIITLALAATEASGADLAEAVTLSGETHEVDILGIDTVENDGKPARRVSIQITAGQTAYICHQVGVYGKLDTGPDETLLMVVQDDRGVEIPAASTSSEFKIALAVLLAVLVGTIAVAGWSEGAGALAAIAGVGVYYFALWLFRRKIEHTIQFTITKI